MTEEITRPMGHNQGTQHVLRMLTETVENASRQRKDVAERLRHFAEQITKLHQRVEAAESDNRRLRAEVSSLKGENSRLQTDNTRLMRNLQTMEQAIQLACGDFQETTQFMAEGIRSAMTTGIVPEEVAPPTIGAPLSILRKQMSNSIQPEAPRPMETARSLPLSPEASVSALDSADEVPDDDTLKAMTEEISAMLSNIPLADGAEREAKETSEAA